MTPATVQRAPSKRLTCQIDLASYHALEQQAGGKSMANAVARAAKLTAALKQQAGEGFGEIIVRNRQTGEERVVLLPAG